MSHLLTDGIGPALPNFWEDLSAGGPDGTNDKTEAIRRTGQVYAKGFKAQEGLPVGAGGISDQFGFMFSGSEGDGGMISFPGTDGAIGFAVNAAVNEILRTKAGVAGWSLNAGTIAQANAINAFHYVGVPAGPQVASQIEVSSAGSSVAQSDAVSLLLTNSNKTNVGVSVSNVGTIGASEVANPTASDMGASISFWRNGSANNELGIGLTTRSALGYQRRVNVTPTGFFGHLCDANLVGTFFRSARGPQAAITCRHDGTNFINETVAAWTIVSDQRYKSNVTAFEPGQVRAAIMGIKPVSWTWNELSERERGQKGEGSGFVAQNVLEFAPEVTQKLSNDTLGLQESKLLPYLWAQVQALTEQVDRLTTQLGLAVPVATPAPPSGVSASINLQKAGNLVSMSDRELGAIGFTPAQSKTFIGGSNAIKLGLSNGMSEADVLRLLSALLSSMGLTLSGVLAKI